MNVTFVTTSYPANRESWQAHFMRSLIYALAKNQDLTLDIWGPDGEIPENSMFSLTETDKKFLDNLRDAGGLAHQLKNNTLSAMIMIPNLLFRLRRLYKSSKADVIHINWLQNAIPMIGITKPLVVSVLGTDFKLLKLKFMPWLLRRAFKGKNVILTPNANWMVPELKRLFSDVAEIKAVPFGVNKELLENKRQILPEIPHWLVVSRITSAKLGELLNWGEGLFGPDRKLTLLGPMQEDIELPDWIEYEGATHPEELVKQWFPNVTGLLSLSQHSEGCPQIILDGMAAGVPTVVTDIDGHREAVIDGVNGVLVTSKQSLEKALASVEEPILNERLSQKAREETVSTRGDWQKTSKSYYLIYQRLSV